MISLGGPTRIPASRIRVEHWVVAQRQGQAAARNILGLETVRCRALLLERPLRSVDPLRGPRGAVGRCRVDGDVDSGDCAVRYMLAGRAIATATVGRDLESLRFEAASERMESARLL